MKHVFVIDAQAEKRTEYTIVTAFATTCQRSAIVIQEYLQSQKLSCPLLCLRGT